MRPLPLLGLMVSDHFTRSDLTTGANWVKSKETPYNPDMMINLALMLEDFVSHIRCSRVTMLVLQPPLENDHIVILSGHLREFRLYSPLNK